MFVIVMLIRKVKRGSIDITFCNKILRRGACAKLVRRLPVMVLVFSLVAAFMNVAISKRKVRVSCRHPKGIIKIYEGAST